MPSVERARDAEPLYELPYLPYKEDALEPFISAETLAYHYGKHHKAYVDRVNQLVQNTKFAGLPLQALILRVGNDADYTELFNNAAQAWNHTFYWHSLTPDRGSRIPAELEQRITASFGSVSAFRDQFVKAAVERFGSGWAWLVLDGDALKIVTTTNAQNPLLARNKPLLTIDVWEHAYYLDYQNRRAEYARAVVESLLNWNFALGNLHRD